MSPAGADRFRPTSAAPAGGHGPTDAAGGYGPTDTAGAGGHEATDAAGGRPRTDAAALLDVLAADGRTLAVAESLTGGAVCDALVGVPGASRVLRGGVVSYATDVKATVLGVDPVLLAAHGAVHPQVAAQMSDGVRRVLGADVGLATTGVAGPEPADGRPVGTVYVAVATGEQTRVQRLDLTGDRAQVRAAAVDGVLALALDVCRSGRAAQDGPPSGR